MSFFVPLFGNGLTNFQPVFIDDISLAVEKIIKDNIQGQGIYELAGPRAISYKEFYNYMMTRKKFWLIPIPRPRLKLCSFPKFNLYE